jgi:glycerol-3-phosphate acyltransferase PlsY
VPDPLPLLNLAALLAGAYLVGSIPFGLLVARCRGVDIRRCGSGNVGATNVGRVLGFRWGLLVFLLDLGKGAASTVGAGLLLDWPVDPSRAIGSLQRDVVWLAAGLACVLGSIAPLYLRFRGGKGVAASLGAVLGIYPYLTLPGLVVLVAWALVVRLTGYVSLGSMVAAGLLPISFLAFARLRGWGLSEHYPLLALCIGTALLILLRHRDNLRRLMAGTENRWAPRRRAAGPSEETTSPASGAARDRNPRPSRT